MIEQFSKWFFGPDLWEIGLPMSVTILVFIFFAWAYMREDLK